MTSRAGGALFLVACSSPVPWVSAENSEVSSGGPALKESTERGRRADINQVTNGRIVRRLWAPRKE